MSISAKNKIVFSVFAFFTVVVIVMTGISYQSFSLSSHKAELDELDTVSRAVGKAVGEKTDIYFNALELAARMFNGVPNLSGDELLTYRINLSKQLKEQTRAGEAYFCFSDGSTYTAGREGIIPNFKVKAKQREWYKRLFGGEKRIITTPYTSSIGAIVMAAGVPIMKDGRMQATLCINLGLTDITEFANSVLDHKNIFLTRADGYIMANRDKELIGKSLWESIPELEKYRDQTSNGRVKFSLDGKSYEGSLYIIEGLNWKVWTYEELDVINQDSTANLQQNAIVAVLALILAALMLNFLASSLIFKPLGKGVEFAAAVAGGDLDKTLDVQQNDEVGVLAEALRTMVGKLKDMIRDTEEKSALAEQEAERARKAMAEAEEAREQADRATREGILQAASQIEGVVDRIASGTEELAAQADEINNSTEVQRERMTETATSMEQMNASVLEVARNSGDAASNAMSTQEAADKGTNLVNKVIESVSNVQQQTQAMKADLTSLGEQADSIGAIMDVINDIADQTNLLALNAAIEAARAGEAGRGFAVVADEVRKLAEKTIGATQQVGESISSIQAAARKNIKSMDHAAGSVDETTELAANSGEVLENILNYAQENAEQVQSIATAAEEQSAASEEINQAVEEVSRISAETSESMAQSAIAIEELAEMTSELSKIVDQLKQS
ncbi:methyl-accepting chemotaxis protein [Desulfovibrio sp. JC022]|uniref:methyl-accepting chemotaxis protein n=1 Tax=Desulfovibrio sp. JC022 TaxID=2593642 RepID=UPI0013D0A78C|nr:methyl-accepting chemotaxis protein [Desulfovibrio sp. JC022]